MVSDPWVRTPDPRTCGMGSGLRHSCSLDHQGRARWLKQGIVGTGGRRGREGEWLDRRGGPAADAARKERRGVESVGVAGVAG